MISKFELKIHLFASSTFEIQNIVLLRAVEGLEKVAYYCNVGYVTDIFVVGDEC
jgi:hypothetical protein